VQDMARILKEIKKMTRKQLAMQDSEKAGRHSSHQLNEKRSRREDVTTEKNEHPGSVSSINPTSTFALFEPCHPGDKYDKVLSRRKGCASLLWSLADCDFDHVQQLWGWNNPHTTNGNERTYSKESATELCSSSDLVAFKTVDVDERRPMKTWAWLMDAKPHLRVLNMVRDPRGIWASWKSTPAFQNIVDSGELGTLPDICKIFNDDLDFKDDRVHRIIFEKLIKDPVRETQNVYEFLGLPFGDDQLQWVKRTFDATNCPEYDSWYDNFTDCHQASQDEAEKWRTVLTREELNAFYATPECARIVHHFGYPTS